MTDTATEGWVCTRCSTASPQAAAFCRGCGAPAQNAAAAPIAAPSGARVPADLGRRFGAVVIDGLIATVVALLASVAVGMVATGMIANATDYSAYSGIYGFAAIAPSVLQIGYALIYAAMQGGGGSPGMRLLGIRLVAWDTGGPAGFARALGRNIVYSLCGAIIVGYFSPLFDKSGQNRGWHDQASNTMMIDARAEAAGRAPQVRPQEAVPTASVAVTAPEQRADPAAGGSAGPVPAAPEPFSAHPVGLLSPAPLPPAPLPPVAPPPAALLAPAAWSPAPPVAAPAPGVISAVPGRAATVEPFVPDELDLTRMSAASPAPARRPSVLLRFDDGTTAVVADSALIGRDPAPRTGEAAGELIALPDASRSLSKTHARLELVDGEISVIDRHSTNGTAVTLHGTTTTVPPGGRLAVPAGATIAFGDRTATVEWA